MKQEALTQFPTPWMTAIGLILFFFSFAAILLWTYRLLKQKEVDTAASMALSDGDVETIKMQNRQKEG